MDAQKASARQAARVQQELWDKNKALESALAAAQADAAAAKDADQLRLRKVVARCCVLSARADKLVELMSSHKVRSVPHMAVRPAASICCLSQAHPRTQPCVLW